MANVVISKALKDRIAAAYNTLNSNNDASARAGAIAELEDVKYEIEALIDSGKTPTNISKRIIDTIDGTISRESEDAPTEDEEVEEVEPEHAKITQNFFTVTLTANPSDSIYGLANEIAVRLEDYIVTEDISAEYSIEIEKSSEFSFKRNGYTLKLGVDGSTTADQAFRTMASALVTIFDEMDSDYDGDVDEFLMDI
ncbi:MAG: hypothetical protein ACO4AM_05525 [Candidatus Nanopelagicaceae bacterium]